MDLFTKEEIEKFGFKYEPDATKCKTTKTGPHYKCNYYEDGKLTNPEQPVLTDEWKSRAAETIKARMPQWTHLHSVFVPDVSPMGGGNCVMCQFVMIRGHGNELTDKWFKTGMLEGLKPEQFYDAALFLNGVTKELLSSDPKEGTPEYLRLEKLAGIVLPVSRDLFDKFYPKQPDPKWIVEQCDKFFDEKQDLYESLKTGIAQDHEREFGFACFKHLEEIYEMHCRTK